MESIGERLARVRKQRMLTQAEVAQEAGLAVVTVNRLEADDPRNNPRFKTLRAIARVILRVTKVSPRIGLSWLNRMPLQAYRP